MIVASEWEMAKAVRTAMNEGKATAHTEREAEQAVQKKVAAMMKGQPAC